MLQLNPGTLAGFKQLMGTIFFNKAMLTDQFIEQGWAAKLKRNDGYTVNSFIESILRGEDTLDGRLGAIKAPTLIIWGREDSLTPLAWGEAFARDIPGSKLLIIDRCGHVPQVECAAPFQAELIKFLAGSAAAAAK
jgi:triacylglycerol lipase